MKTRGAMTGTIANPQFQTIAVEGAGPWWQGLLISPTSVSEECDKFLASSSLERILACIWITTNGAISLHPSELCLLS